MDVLIDALFEIFGEVIFEVLFHLVSAIFLSMVNFLDRNDKTKSILKNTLIIIFFGLSIVLVTLSLLYRKTTLVIITLSYLLIFIILQLVRYLNRHILKKRYITLIYLIIKWIIDLALPILLIVFGVLTIKNDSGKSWLILLSTFSLAVLIFVNAYKLYKFVKKPNYF